MNNKSQSFTDLLRPEALRSLATPSNFRLGEEIAKNGGVELVETSPLRIVAKVQPKGGQRRTVELCSTDKD